MSWNDKKWLDLRKGDHFKTDEPDKTFVVNYYDDVDDPGSRMVVYHELGDRNDNSYYVVHMSSTETVLVLDRNAAAKSVVDEALAAMRANGGVE